MAEVGYYSQRKGTRDMCPEEIHLNFVRIPCPDLTLNWSQTQTISS